MSFITEFVLSHFDDLHRTHLITCGKKKKRNRGGGGWQRCFGVSTCKFFKQ